VIQSAANRASSRSGQTRFVKTNLARPLVEATSSNYFFAFGAAFFFVDFFAGAAFFAVFLAVAILELLKRY